MSIKYVFFVPFFCRYTIRLSLGQHKELIESNTTHRNLNIVIDLLHAQGLVDLHLTSNRFKDALFVAKEALQQMPRCASALALIGLVLCHSSDGKEKARLALTKVWDQVG